MAKPKPNSNTKQVSHYYDWHADFDDVSEATPLGFAWVGIMIAAGCYPIVVGVILVVWNLPFSLPVRDCLELMTGIIVYGLFSVGIGLLYGFLMSGPAFILTQILRWSLNGIISSRGAIGVYGGMTGFLCISTVLLLSGGVSIYAESGWFYSLLAALLAIAMGYLGAIWFGYLKRNHGFPFFEPLFSLEKQITIGYLMKLTFVVAVSVIIFRAMGPVGPYIAVASSVYVIAQILLLVCDHWITQRWRVE